MIRVFFDTTELSGNDIKSLSQSVNPFKDSFKAGLTVCRQFDLSINKNCSYKMGIDDGGLYYCVNEDASGEYKLGLDSNGLYYTTDEQGGGTFDVGFDGIGLYYTEEHDSTVVIPNRVYIYEDDYLYATLLVDSYDDEDLFYTSYVLTDVMVQFNKKLYFEEKTVTQLLNQICSNHGITLVNQNLYMGDLLVNWGSGDITERDFISYVAEVNGGYAYINEQGNLAIEAFSNVPQGNINLEDCSSFKLGSKHLIDRVYVELGSATHYYPDESDNDTLYLNPENILLTDGDDYTIQETVEHIQSVINGLTFFDIEVEMCPVLSNVRACQMIAIDGYPTLASIDWDFNSKWIGGYKLDVQTSKQEETNVDGMDSKVKKILIAVDRELNTIRQQISGIEGDISTLEQTDTYIQNSFVKMDNDKFVNLSTNIVFDINGINIKSSNVDTSLQLDATGVKVIDNNNNVIVNMTGKEFDMGEWIYAQTGSTLNIYKRQ